MPPEEGKREDILETDEISKAATWDGIVYKVSYVRLKSIVVAELNHQG